MNGDSEITQKESSKKRYWPYLFIFTILLFFCVFGITYSFYKGDDSNSQELETGQIVFTYSDVGQAGNGILIENALPISDDVGKVLTGTNQYFDFYITANTKKSNVEYKLLIDKDIQSTLADDKVRIYLTRVMGSFEQELMLVDFSSLKQETIDHHDYYLLYTKTLEKGLENYNDSYRLRMWIKESATHYEEQYFSIKIDVSAYQVEG